MNKLLILTITCLVTAGIGSAHPFSMEMLYEENTDHLVNETNVYADRAPKFLGSLVGDQTINVRIKSGNTTEEVGVKMNGTEVQQIQLETYNRSTLEVNTTEKQIKNITASENPIKNLNQTLKSGDIKYSSKGTVNSLRTYIAEQLLSLTSLI